jgi:hypothetical protein
LRTYNILHPEEVIGCIKSNVETVNILMNLGASVNIYDKYKMTPLFYAFQNKNYYMIKFLLKQYEVSINQPININGVSPLTYYINMYKHHLQSFVNNTDTIDNINNFVSPFLDRFNRYLSDNNQHIAYINDFPLRTFIMITQIFKDYSKNNLNEELNIIYSNVGTFNMLDNMNVSDIQKNMQTYTSEWDVYYNTIRKTSVSLFPIY